MSSLSLRLVDRTACSPATYRVRERAPEEVDLLCLHQTATPPGMAESALDRTKAHALVSDDGAVLQFHGWLERLRFGSGPWNSRCVTIEHRANLPGRYHLGSPRWAGKAAREEWSADGRRAQVLGARALLARLREELPALRFIGAHRQVDAPRKGGCCGPDLWREVGEWAVRELGLEVVATAPTGADLPPDWRRAPTILGEPGGAVGGRPVAPPCPLAVTSEPSPLAA